MTSELAIRWRDQWQTAISSPDLFAFLNENASATPAEKVDVILLDQGERWQTTDPIRVEDYLHAFPELINEDHAVSQLVIGEFESRLACDLNPNIDEYTSRFSSLGETLRSRLQQILTKSGTHSSGSGNADIATSDDIRSPPVAVDQTVDSSRLAVEDTETLTHVSSEPDSSVWIGRYRRLRLLGEGAFGRVWLGQDEELGRRVAIKVPRAERFRGPEDAEAYLAEARTVAGLDHPHIVPVYDVGRTEDGSVFVVSKFIEGKTLGERIKQGVIEFDEIAKLLATAALALDHAHQQRLIHRDIKPENILLEDRTGTPHVADFGLAISEEQYLRDGRLAGTPAYMSPEQARGEGHRLDGRSDIFSLGVVFYEMLTRKRPFRGSSASELMHQVISLEPSPPRDVNDEVPAELERICLKSLSKRAADRYPTAREMAEDLSQWQQGDNPSFRERTIVPRGLRSFGADDADFFLELLPGPRDRDGLPESIRFWKSRIEQTDPEKTFNVGLIYGPSGCGKSSLVKAGLLPRLSKQVVPLYIEATPDDTENRILRGLRKLITDLPETLSLVESFAWLRRNSSPGSAWERTAPQAPPAEITIGRRSLDASVFPGRAWEQGGRAVPKVVIVLDQFEQWLHSHASNPNAELIAALRQCDGGHLQAIAMVRDDFAMAAARFMDALEVPILQGENFATVDLFDVDHAERVLIKFGQAFGKLPSISGNMTDNEREFVTQVASGLADDGKVVSVRLSLFAEMVKGKPWTLQTLEDVGGTDGIGVNFLEDTFSSRNANPKHRLHEKAARAVLATLLPEIGSNIKGHMRSHSELLAASGYESQTAQFATLMQFLDGELRLITPTDPDGEQSATASDPDAKFYQLAHDYMVPSLRQWLTRKQQETRSGRAELKLDERTNLWTAKPENRHLPSALEWASIRSLTDRSKWTPPQQRMMQRAGRVHTSRMSMALATVVLLACGGFWIKSRVDLGNQQTTASGLVAALLSAETRDVQKLVAELAPYRVWTDPELETALSSTDGKAQLHARIALLPMDPTQTAPLQAALLDATPENVMVLRDVLQPHSENLSDSYWQILQSTDETKPQRRLSAAAALAKFAPDDPRWSDVATSVTKLLVDENPLRLATWIEAFRPVRASLVPELGVIFRDQSEDVTQTQRDLATNILETYAADNVEELAELILDAQPKQFASLFDEFEAHGDAAKTKMLETLDSEPARKLWDDADVVSLKDKPIATEVSKSIEAADGIITDRFALVQTLKLDQFMALTKTLSKSGYRPVRLRPYNSQAVKPNPASAADVSPPLAAAIWHRDGRPWRVTVDQTAEEIQARDEELRGEGFAAVDVAGYISVRDEKPTELFVAVWVQRNDDSDESRIYTAATDNDHKTTYGELEKSGYVFQQALHVFRGLDGQPRYSGVKLKQDVMWTRVWDRSPDSYGEIVYLDRPQWDISLTLGKSIDASQSSVERQIAETTAAVEKKPKDRSARLRRAVAFYQQSKFTEAINDLDQLIEKSPSFPDSYQYRALCYARLANGNAAEDDLKNLRELLKSPAAIAYTTAIVQAYGGDFTSGEKTLADFALIIPEPGDGFYSIACAYAILASISKPIDQTRSSKYASKALEALKVAIDAGQTDTEQILIELDFESIRENPSFNSLLERNQIDRQYAAIWNPVAGLESQELHGMSPTEHRQAMRHLELDDFIPVSISALVSETVQESVAASVWHRKTIPATISAALAKQQANAAAALARLGESDKIFAALRITDDPESLTQFVHRCRGEGVTTTELLECLEAADQSRQSLSGDLRRVEDRVLYGLLLALGEFAVDELPPTQRDAAVDQVAKWFSDDPSSAIHGVTGWLLRQWGQTDFVQRVDQKAVAYDPHREWFTLVIEAGEQRFYQTYVVIAPGDYDVGSPADAPERESDENRNRVRLTRPVAILDREVTRGEFEASGVYDLSSTQYSPTTEHPMAGPSWYDSVRYCRWLTERAGFSEAEQAYADPAKLDKGAYPLDGDAGFSKNWPFDLTKRGFRMPTEAEWEIAARGGMRTTFGFGEDESLLNRYAWFQENSNRQTHLAKELRPNLRGLFDMRGSAFEWCHDLWSTGYGTGSVRTNPAGANSGSDRVMRGGSFNLNAAFCRSAYRHARQPHGRFFNCGLRVALVPFEQSK